MVEFRADFPSSEERRLEADVARLTKALAHEHAEVVRLTGRVKELEERRSMDATEIECLKTDCKAAHNEHRHTCANGAWSDGGKTQVPDPPPYRCLVPY